MKRTKLKEVWKFELMQMQNVRKIKTLEHKKRTKHLIVTCQFILQGACCLSKILWVVVCDCSYPMFLSFAIGPPSVGGWYITEQAVQVATAKCNCTRWGRARDAMHSNPKNLKFFKSSIYQFCNLAISCLVQSNCHLKLSIFMKVYFLWARP